MTRKLHQATRRSSARGTSECLGTRLLVGVAEKREALVWHAVINKNNAAYNVTF